MPDGSSDTVPVTIVIFPGASLMEIRSLAVGITLVRCPGCDATLLVAQTVPSHLAFVHEDPDCPILARIKAALAQVRTALAVEAN
jgi:hypothetical protein